MEYLRNFDEKEFKRRNMILDLNDKEYGFQQNSIQLN